MRRHVAMFAAAFAITACNDLTAPVPVQNEAVAGLQIVNAPAGVIPSFQFLPPLGPQKPHGGALDTGRSPVVEVCPLSDTGQCGVPVARFTMLESDGQKRIKVDHSSYKVEWKSAVGLPLAPIYRIRVIDGSELGHVDVKLVEKGKDAKSVPAGLFGLVAGSNLQIKFRIEKSSGQPAVRLEIHPGSFLLPGAGSSTSLEVLAFDANGQPTAPGAVTWNSLKPQVLTVAGDGVATAIAGTGSAQVTVSLGNIVSPPVLGLVSTVPSDALLVGDDNILSPPLAITSSVARSSMSVSGSATSKSVIVPVDPTAPYKPGWQFKVYLQDVAPTVGQLLISQGESAVGGRVVSVAPYADGLEVIMSLVSLSEMLPGLSINESLALVPEHLQVNASIAAAYDVTHNANGGSIFHPKGSGNFRFASQLGATPRVSSVLATESEFELGPFECKIETSGTAVQPDIGTPSFHIDPDLTLDLVYTQANGLERLVARGSIDGGVTVKPVYPLEVEEKLGCEMELATIHLPVSGPLALFVGGEIPVGVGFEVDGKLTAAQFGVDVAMNAGVTVSLGIACTVICGPVGNVGGSATGSFAPIIPNLTNDLRSEFSASGFLTAKLNIGNAFIEALQFEILDAQGGFKQQLKAASAHAQANDAAFASSIDLSFDVEAKTGSSLNELAALLGISLDALSFESSTPLASSPKALSFTITPATVRGATATDAGTKAKFILNLDPVTYVGSYAVDSIELYRKKTTGGSFVLESVPAPCGQIAPTSGQSLFACEAILPGEWSGQQTIYAFVKPKIFGVAVPLLLELSNDAQALVTVDTVTQQSAVSVVIDPPSASIAPAGTQQFSATVAGTANQAVTWTTSAGSIFQTGLFSAGSTTGSVTITATSVQDPTKSGTATVIIGTPTTLNPYIEYAYEVLLPTIRPATCDSVAIKFGFPPEPPIGSFAYTCHGTWSDPTSGDALDATASVTSNYAVFTDGTGSQVISFSGITDATATKTPGSNGTSGTNAVATGLSSVKICFQVPLAQPHSYALTGTLEAPGLVGISSAQAALEFSGTDTNGVFNSYTFAGIGQPPGYGTQIPFPPTQVLNRTGVFPAGANACIKATILAGAQSVNGTATIQARLSNVQLKLMPQ